MPPLLLAVVVMASLADCLACLGCITMAETVLLEEQHSLQVYKDLIVRQLITMNINDMPKLTMGLAPADISVSDQVKALIKLYTFKQQARLDDVFQGNAESWTPVC